MTHTDDSLALLTACHLHPDEDTPRLIWADAIEEADPARAELVRLQIKLANNRVALPSSPVVEWTEDDQIRNDLCECLHEEITALLIKHADRWRTGPQCAACRGKGLIQGERWTAQYYFPDNCPTCFSTGDAGGLMGVVHVTYERGLKVITVPALTDVVVGKYDQCPKCRELNSRRGAGGAAERRCGECDGGVIRVHEPSPRLRSWVRYHPDVSEVRVEDWPPVRVGTLGWAITSENNGRRLPDEIASQLYRGSVPILHPTAALALTALARAVPRWARKTINEN